MCSYPSILQVFNVSSTVTILHSSGQNPEAFSSDSVYYRTSIREKVDTPDDQHAAVICKPERTATMIHQDFVDLQLVQSTKWLLFSLI